MFTFWHRKKSIPLLVRQGVQTRRFLTATGRQVQSITPPANQWSDTCSCKKVHRRLVFNQFQSNLSIKERKKKRNNNKKEWVGGWGGGASYYFLPNVSIQTLPVCRSFPRPSVVDTLHLRRTPVNWCRRFKSHCKQMDLAMNSRPRKSGRSQSIISSLPPALSPTLLFFPPLAHLLARRRGGVKVVLMSEQRSRPPHRRLRWE